jgi:spermidine/putrescine transport system substrate-binding protein
MRITRRRTRFTLAAVAIVSLFLAASCGSSASPGNGGGSTGASQGATGASGTPSATGAGGSSGAGSQKFAGQTLTVACWQSYGCDDPAILAGFKKLTGATVKNVFYTSEDGLLQLLRQGGTGKIDVALPNLEYTVKGYNEGLFQPIDTSKISSWDDIVPKLRQVDAVDYQGKVISVPWMTGETSLVVNPDKVKPVPDSWSVLWDSSSAGKVGFFDDPTTAIMTAALYLGEDPLNPDLTKVKAALLQLKKNTRVIWSSGDEWNKAYLSDSITMGNLWSSQAVKLKLDGKPIDYIVPKEGTVAWVDAWTIVKNAPHLDLAYAWIDYLTGKDSYLAWSLEENPSNLPPLSTNQKAYAALPAKFKERHPDSGIFTDPSKVAFQEGISTDLLNQWTQTWQAVKAG